MSQDDPLRKDPRGPTNPFGPPADGEQRDDAPPSEWGAPAAPGPAGSGWAPPGAASGWAPPGGAPSPAAWAPPTGRPLPPGWAPPGGGGLQGRKTNGKATASLVLGILGLPFICPLVIPTVLALVFGYQSRREIDRSGGQQGGRGLAQAGIILGWVSVGLFVLIILGFIVLAAIGEEIRIDEDSGEITLLIELLAAR